jgi:hypothetical protein
VSTSQTNGGAFQFSFGASVALQGDTLVVGAPGESSGASGVNGDQTDSSVPAAGAVYVFTRSGTTWSQQAYIKPQNGGTEKQFGYSVALDGDTLVVGAPDDGNQGATSAPQVGAAYVFTRAGGAWSQQAYLKSPRPPPNLCGYSVAVSGDTLAFSCGEESGPTPPDGGSPTIGAVYVLTRQGGTWSQQACLQPPGFGGLGYSVALEGDVLAASAALQTSPADGSSRAQGGVVGVFSRTGSAWSQEAYLSAVNGPSDNSGPPSVNDYFGWSLSLSKGTLAVGAPRNRARSTRAGIPWSGPPTFSRARRVHGPGRLT